MKHEANQNQIPKTKLSVRQAIMAKSVLEGSSHISFSAVAESFGLTKNELVLALKKLEKLGEEAQAPGSMHDDDAILFYRFDDELVSGDSISTIPVDEPLLEEEPIIRFGASGVRTKKVTFRTVNLVVSPASEVLHNLQLPNDMNPDHIELMESLLKTIKDLEVRLDRMLSRGKRLEDEDANLRAAVAGKLPLWKKAWEEFVLKGAGAAGSSFGKSSLFVAGFVAGSLYSTFSE